MAPEKRVQTTSENSARTGQFWASSLTVIALLVVALLAGCESSETDEYREAVSALQEARSERDAAVEQLNNSDAELEELKAQLDAAERELAAAQREVQAAWQGVEKHAKDVVLFRVIQQELLDEFEDTAIMAMVSDGVVTLRGNVTDPAQRAAAEKIARDQPGVAEVRNRIEVRSEQESESA